MQKQRKISVSWNDLRGEDALDRARLYIVKLGGLRFSVDRREWQNIRRYEKLRHYIVHRAGRVRKDDVDTWRFAKRKQLVSADGSVNEDLIMLTSDFCVEVLEDMKGFLSNLHQELKQALDGSASRKRQRRPINS